jgi:hypothetical protein
MKASGQGNSGKLGKGMGNDLQSPPPKGVELGKFDELVWPLT